MTSNQDQGPKGSTSLFTPRTGLGTQPRQSYSAGELATPSGEVIFNFRPTRLDEEATLSSGEQQVLHAESMSNSHLLGEVEDSWATAEVPTSRGGRAEKFLVGQGSYNRGDFGQGEIPVWARSNLDGRVQSDGCRAFHSGVGTDSLPLYRTARTDRERDLTLPMRSMFKKSANYDGTSSFQDYLVQFEMTSELNRWDDTVKAMELATSLRGAAQSILSDLRPEQRRSYDHLVSVLTARFEPINQTELYRAQINGRLRKKSENVQELAQDIKRLVRRAYPQASSDLRDQIARDCFIDALNEHELEWFVYQGKPKTVDEATQLALEFEAFQSGRKRSQMVR